MSSFRIEFHLRQETPLIHFKHEEKGARLRASEVKPRFNKYLRTILGNKNIDYDELLIEKTNSFDYEIFIKSNDLTKTPIPKHHPFCIFTMDKENEYYHIMNKDLVVEFFSYNKKLLKYINTYFPQFIFENNFGMRNGKGFGSYIVVDELGKEIEVNKDFLKLKIQVNKNDIYKSLFRDLELFYKTMRSGINRKNKDETVFYFKSLLFEYAKFHGITWDKKTFKKVFKNREYVSSPLLVRDFLGLARNQRWRKAGFTLEYSEDNYIQRIKSPITFKPIINENGDFTVYILFKPISKDLEDQKVIIKKNKNKGVEFSFWNEFKIEEYLEFIKKNKNIEEHIKKYKNYEIYRHHQDFKKLKKIYNSLEGNIRSVT